MLLDTHNSVADLQAGERGSAPKQAIADALKAVARDGLDMVAVHRSHRWDMLVCTVCGDDLALH